MSIGRLRLMPLLVVVVVDVLEESAGFFSACSFAWSFFQLLDRSVVVIPGMTGTDYECIVGGGEWNNRECEIELVSELKASELFWKAGQTSGPSAHGLAFYGRNNEQDALDKVNITTT